MIIAVDFDGTLATNNYPLIGEPIWEVINFVKKRKEMDDTIILWTCRDGVRLNEAIEWTKQHGLEFDYINENCKERIKIFGSDTRKIFANIYIDDKALNPQTTDSLTTDFEALSTHILKHRKSLQHNEEGDIITSGG